MLYFTSVIFHGSGFFIYRDGTLNNFTDTLQATLQANEEVLEAINRVIMVLDGEMKRAMIQELLGMKDRVNFVSNYLTPSLESTLIEMTIPETPTHQEQRYRLTSKGIELKKKLQKSKRKK